jgi:NAD(P)-dependent dehydrogenase (short-subunit alcohol dehydrogenase family)
MNLQGAVAVVTGAARGIGRALAERFAAEGARAVVVTDLDGAEAGRVAAGLACPAALGVALDVTDPAAVAGLVNWVEDEVGQVDLWCSNAGVALGPDLGTGHDWERSFAVHVLAHVHLARALAPRMAARGRGHLLLTASAAGLLTNMDSAPYAVTKHGTVALAEWLAIRWGDAGGGVVPVPAGGAHGHDRGDGPGQLGTGRRGAAGAGGGGRGGGPRAGRRPVPDPAPSRGGGVRAPPGRRPRPLAGRHAPGPGPARELSDRTAAGVAEWKVRGSVADRLGRGRRQFTGSFLLLRRRRRGRPTDTPRT